MKPHQKLFSGLATVGLLTFSALPSFSKELSKATVSDAPQTLQLTHILAPAQVSTGSFTSSMRAMTPILVVSHASSTPLVCQRGPRITEALLKYFLQSPAPVNKTRRIDSDVLSKQSTLMASHVNKAIGQKAVSAVYIIEGSKAMTTGVAARLPFANAKACGAILEAYEKQVQEMLNK